MKRGTDKQGLLILLVEDQDALREAVRKLLVARKHVVLAAGSCAQAKELIESPQNRFNVALIDWKLADCDGTDLIRLLHPRGIPSYLLTGYTLEHIREQYVDPLKHVRGVVGKPIDWKILDAWLDKIDRAREHTPPRGTNIK